MPEFRIGHGYDVHRLVEGRRLVLGGVEIPYIQGLEGHSDADVALHAVMDALLGAAGLPDIGQQFPPSEAKWKDADSLELLARVRQLLEDDGVSEIINIDVTIAAQAPKLASHLAAMKAATAKVLQIDESRVNYKATTTEGLGPVGRGEGMTATAVCLICRE